MNPLTALLFLTSLAALGCRAEAEFVIPNPHQTLIPVYYSPYYPDGDLGLECRFIKELTARRLADQSNQTGAYQVRYAVYNIQEECVIERLIEARAAGVQVQVLIDAGQLLPNETWNTGWRQLVKAGFSYSPTQIGLNASAQESLNLIGITMAGWGLEHLKTRLFAWPGGARLITGSFNPEGAAFLNNETLLATASPALIAQYTAKYLSVRAHQNHTNQWLERPVNPLFSPTYAGPNPADVLLAWLAAEEEVILISVYSFNQFNTAHASLVWTLVERAQAGVYVAVLTDAAQANMNPWTSETLSAHGIPVFKCTNPASQYNAMHNKNGLFGLRWFRIVTDTGNWSGDSLGSATAAAANDESFLFIDCKKTRKPSASQRCRNMGLLYLSNWLALARFYQGQNQNVTSANAILEDLVALPNWPVTNVNVAATGPVLQTADMLFVSGNITALGDWGLGVALTQWQPVANSTLFQYFTELPIQIPFGTPFQYRFGLTEANGFVWVSDIYEAIADPVLIPRSGGDIATMTMTVTGDFN